MAAVMVYIIEFFLFSFIGWIIDSAYRSIAGRRWINAGYFKGPVCPIYGFGGIILVSLMRSLGQYNLVLMLVITSLAMVLVEYVGGIFSEKVLKVRLWDYSKTTFNLGGHIDLLHSVYWVILVVLFYYFIYPLAIAFEDGFAAPAYMDIPVLVIFVLGGIWLTLRKNPQQYLELKNKMLNLSVADYRDLFSNLKKLSKTHSPVLKKKILEKIRPWLSRSGAKLKK